MRKCVCFYRLQEPYDQFCFTSLFYCGETIISTRRSTEQLSMLAEWFVWTLSYWLAYTGGNYYCLCTLLVILTEIRRDLMVLMIMIY